MEVVEKGKSSEGEQDLGASFGKHSILGIQIILPARFELVFPSAGRHIAGFGRVHLLLW